MTAPSWDLYSKQLESIDYCLKWVWFEHESLGSALDTTIINSLKLMVYLYIGQTHHATMCWNPIPIGNNEHVQPVRMIIVDLDHKLSSICTRYRIWLKNMEVWNFKGTSRHSDWL